MILPPWNAMRAVRMVLSLSVMVMLLSPAAAQQALSIKPLVEKKLAQLPAGPLYWRIEIFPTLGEAQAAAGPTSLATEVSGKAWLSRLVPRATPLQVAARSPRSAPYPQSLRRSICYASIMPAARQVPKPQ